jgi:hypothetical protein
MMSRQTYGGDWDYQTQRDALVRPRSGSGTQRLYSTGGKILVSGIGKRNRNSQMQAMYFERGQRTPIDFNAS